MTYLYNTIVITGKDGQMAGGQRASVSLGKQIRDLRMERGLTLKELSERIGVHFTTVSSWERGRSMPGYDLMPRLSTALGIVPGDLFGRLWGGTGKAKDSASLRPVSPEQWDDIRRLMESVRFGMALERSRSEKGIEKREISKATGISSHRLQEILNGCAGASLLEAVALASAVGLKTTPGGDGSGPRVSPDGANGEEKTGSLDQLLAGIEKFPETGREGMIRLLDRILKLIQQ